MMMFLFYVSLVLLAFYVLLIGNIYVYVNYLPTVFSNLTTSLGEIETVDSKATG